MKTGTMTYKTTGRKSGFTMVELLIAIIIIGILTAIIVPVLSNRASDARLAAAQADLESLANGESQVALDTGYVVRLHVLDDSGAVSDNLGSNDLGDVADTIRDEDINLGAGNPSLIFLDAKTGLLLPQNLFDRAELDPEKFGWRGPYLNFQRKIEPASPPITPWTYGSPLDPWGNPYFLFVGGDQSTLSGATGGWFNEVAGDVQPTFTYGGTGSFDATQFDRMTLLSLGPNGLPGDGSPTAILGGGDDLVRAF